MRRLAAHFPVVWVEPAATWQDLVLPTGARFLAADRFNSPVPGLEVFTPGYRHPLVFQPHWLGQATLRSQLETARRRLVARGARRVVLYLWRDAFEDALDLVPHDVSCYHVDDEYTFSEVDLPNSPRETRILQRVDQVIVHSAALFAKKGHVNPHTARVPNGVDFRTFASPCGEPPDLAAVPRPRIGYVGVIKKQLDLGLLVRLAQARPQYSFLLVGPVLNIAGKEQHVAALTALPNVFLLGEKPPDALPAYMQHLDVCLMCYEVNEYTRYIYPLKLHEYMATGRPVVSSQIDSVLAYSDLVTIASTDEQWLQAVDDSVGANAQAPAVAKARQARAREHDWDALVDRIAALFRQALARFDRGEGAVARLDSLMAP
jgi:glycosyltransferase involved in cell wall biosynthesis